ncbi:hypothetical protein DK926_00590 [Rhodococcus sp. Eu-32]|uniref:alpha/beta hydrolase n=1 Tax=Rhodococcus sp. Eu-32 TaxID=1017319 RepID=UPI000DF3EA2E|nr:hypothetical protein [Rhodococcus sp. Eu-32]RRQ29414.1 hypothetical protein DK926_00590 [Rhodococcus sp. Eu-32]
MTFQTQFDEPAGLGPRGTLVVLPGRGDSGALYERFGARIAADAYRVRIADTIDVATAFVNDEDIVHPVVLVGVDTGALQAVQLANGTVDALVLAGVPVAGHDVTLDDEVDAKVSCPTTQGRLRDDASLSERGALTTDHIAADLQQTTLDVTIPVLALHGRDDVVSPLDAARERYAAAKNLQLAVVEQGRHDPLNSLNHRSVAATVVVFLETLKSGAKQITEEVLK